MSQSAPVISTDTSYLQDPLICKHLSDPENNKQMRFMISGMHCASCARVIEGLAGKLSLVDAIAVNLQEKTAVVRVEDWPGFEQFVNGVHASGFEARPFQSEENTETNRRKAKQRELKQLAVAGFVSGNIMMMSFAVYSGADPGFSFLFHWLSLILMIPLLIFSARPFYKSFLSGLKAGVPTVDMPIVVAVFFGTVLSTVHLIRGESDIYFDSLAALIFLLLVSRFFLHRLQDRFYARGSLALTSEVAAVRCETSENDEGRWIPIEKVQLGNILRMRQGEILPVDGVALNDVFLNQSLLTGESRPTHIPAGKAVFAGTELQSPSLRLQVTAVGAQTRFGQLLRNARTEQIEKSRFVSWLDRLAQRFTWAVLATAVLILIHAVVSGDVWPGLQRALALLIVACPCALAFGAPLTFSLALWQSGQKGLLIKTPDILEKLGKIRHVFFDKTGTLTSARLQVLNHPLVLSFEDRLALLALESKSQHPIAQAILQDPKLKTDQPLPEVNDFRILPGLGIEGLVQSQRYRLIRSEGSDSSTSQEHAVSRVSFYKNDRKLADIELADDLRETAAELIDLWRRRGLSLHILSGDQDSPVQWIARRLDIPNERAIGRLSPEDKVRLIRRQTGSMMIGDGINDSGALASAEIGIAMAGPIEKLLKTADAILVQNRLTALDQLFTQSERTRVTLRRLAGFSIIYNIVTGTLAALGFVHPLLAAILMPLSSLSVLIIVATGMKEKTWKSSTL